jgi:hypothetical protein
MAETQAVHVYHIAHYTQHIIASYFVPTESFSNDVVDVLRKNDGGSFYDTLREFNLRTSELSENKNLLEPNLNFLDEVNLQSKKIPMIIENHFMFCDH